MTYKPRKTRMVEKPAEQLSKKQIEVLQRVAAGLSPYPPNCPQGEHGNAEVRAQRLLEHGYLCYWDTFKLTPKGKAALQAVQHG